MHLSLILRLFLFSVILCRSLDTFGQSSILDFQDHKIVSSEIGYTAAPFKILYPFQSEISKITYKHNLAPFLRFGFNYKWFSFKFSIPNIGNMRDFSNFGTTKQYNIGTDFSWRKFYYDLEFKYIHGYAIQNAYQWDSTYNHIHSNAIKPSIQSLNVTANAWYFNHKDFKMGALLGKRSYYTSLVHTWYLKGTMNFFGVDSKAGSIIPSILTDEFQSKTASSTFSAFDIGLVPGYAYVNRFGNWQMAGWAGIGGVLQAKFYQLNGDFNGLLGFAPRYDIRVMGGYTTPTYFVFLITDFDNKSIRFNELIYRQNFYSIKLVGGYRFPVKQIKQKTFLLKH